jgi:hypothetical protein
MELLQQEGEETSPFFPCCASMKEAEETKSA